MYDKENHLINPILSNSQSLNSMSSGHSKSPKLDPSTRQHRGQSPSPFSYQAQKEIEIRTQPSIERLAYSPSPLLPPISIEKSTKDRQYGELLIKYNNILIEFSQMEQDLTIKNKTINEQLLQISNYEKFLNHVKFEFGKTKDLMEKELIYYKEMIEDYQLKFLKLNNELEYYKKLEFNQLETYLGSEAEETEVDRYNKLLKDYKILQSNFDIEQNSKIVLMDQIESLSKEIEYLKAGTHDIDNYEFSSHSNSVVEDLTYHYHRHSINLQEADDLEEEEANSEDLDEDIGEQPQSSPIKSFGAQTPRTSVSNSSKRIPSLIQTTDFQFPPSPDPDTKTKRQSLPANLNNDFILSPLKLASQDSEYTKQNRYSISRPSHNRYSSHDIVPIQVEFETQKEGDSLIDRTERFSDLRSASVPSPMRQSNSTLHEEEEEVKELDNTFKRLIGEPEPADNTTTTTTTNVNGQSARSSMLFENNKMFNNELTKQEIMKLKFELQSLKLHNEKLLSYIGFELQKQKKNIRKLKSRQNLEYSDSKLIERSKELLIQKKRVLRSVSINAILSKNYNNKDNIKMLQKGILGFDNEEAINEYDDFEDFDDEEYNDDYGFLKFNDKYSNRIFSNGLNEYYDTDKGKDQNLKKYKSQNFINRGNLSDMFDSSYDTIEDVEEPQPQEEPVDTVDDCDWEEEYRNKKSTKVSGGLFNQIKYLITGNYKVKKHEPDTAIDDGLKYQFLSIAIGIMIIGIRFSQQNHHNV